MERGGSSNARQNYPTRSHRTAGLVIQEGRAIPRTHAAAPIHPQQSFKRDADQYMPIANVTRIMRRVLPANVKIADDAKETIQECVSEFISFITGKANEKCHMEYRKTVTPDDVLSAMELLGFDNYVEPLALYLEKHRAQDPDREPVNNRPPYARRVSHRSPTPIERPIVREPQPISPPSPQPPAPPGGYYIPTLLPRTSSTTTTTYPVDHHGGFFGMPPQMGGYFMGDGGASSDGEEFDPFGQHFK